MFNMYFAKCQMLIYSFVLNFTAIIVLSYCWRSPDVTDQNVRLASGSPAIIYMACSSPFDDDDNNNNNNTTLHV